VNNETKPRVAPDDEMQVRQIALEMEHFPRAPGQAAALFRAADALAAARAEAVTGRQTIAMLTEERDAEKARSSRLAGWLDATIENRDAILLAANVCRDEHRHPEGYDGPGGDAYREGMAVMHSAIVRASAASTAPVVHTEPPVESTSAPRPERHELVEAIALFEQERAARLAAEGRLYQIDRVFGNAAVFDAAKHDIVKKAQIAYQGGVESERLAIRVGDLERERDRLRAPLLEELRWHEADPANQRCTPKRIATLRTALGMESTERPTLGELEAILASPEKVEIETLPSGQIRTKPAPLPDTDPGAHCDYRPEIVRDADGTERVRCLNCWAAPTITAAPDPLKQIHMLAEIERIDRRVADLSEAVNGIGSQASIRDILANTQSGIASLLRRVNEVDTIEIVRLRFAVRDLALLFVAQSNAAAGAATAQGLNAAGTRKDAEQIVARLVGGK
jgi:hypothetical protein